MAEQADQAFTHYLNDLPLPSLVDIGVRTFCGSSFVRNVSESMRQTAFRHIVERIEEIIKNREAWGMLSHNERLLKKVLARDLSAETETDGSRDDFDFPFSEEVC